MSGIRVWCTQWDEWIDPYHHHCSDGAHLDLALVDDPDDGPIVTPPSTRRRVSFTPPGATHKHKWSGPITKGAGIGGWVCVECFAMTDTQQGDTK